MMALLTGVSKCWPTNDPIMSDVLRNSHLNGVKGEGATHWPIVFIAVTVVGRVRSE